MAEPGLDEDAPVDEVATPRRGRRLHRGCRLPVALIVVVIAILGIANAVWLWMGTRQFEQWAKGKIEETLSSRLDRAVTIERLSLERGRHFRIVLENVRIGNAPGATRPFFAAIGRAEVEGELESIRTRTFIVRSVRVINPRLHVEVFPDGGPLHDNVPRWRRSEPAGPQIVRTEIERVAVEDALVELLDRRHEFQAIAHHAEAEIRPGPGHDSWGGRATSPDVAIHLRDYETFSVRTAARLHWEPGRLRIAPAHLDGDGVHARLSGTIVTGENYGWRFDFGGSGELSLARRVFRIEKPISGGVDVLGAIHGDSNGFAMTGSFSSRAVHADVYDIDNPSGEFRVDSDRASLDLRSGTFGGGPVTGSWLLPAYDEPYAMSATIAYRDVPLEAVFESWGMPQVGLVGLAKGTIDYEWNGEYLLEGKGRGETTIERASALGSSAPYPVGARGSTKFEIESGTIRFDDSSIETDASLIRFGGTLGIEHLDASLDTEVRTTALDELDRLFLDLRLSLGKKDPELLGLGGSGTLRGRITGRLDDPEISMKVDASRAKFNHVVVGDGMIDLGWFGSASRLTFRRADFTDADGKIGMTGTVVIPEEGEPELDLKFVARNWDVERAIAIADLDLVVSGRASGHLEVRGTPPQGRARFGEMEIRHDRSRLALKGTVGWAPGEGNVELNLDVAAEAVPVEEIAAFLEVGSMPLSGPVTGTIHLEGPKARLEGAGSVTVRQGVIFGEPIDLAAADLVFTSGVLRATHAEVHLPAGDLDGEGSIDLVGDDFSYVLRPAEIDLEKLAKNPLEGWISGRVRVASSGAGTTTRPDLVLNATLVDGAIRGTVLGTDVPLPSIYVATRDGKLIVRGSGLGHVSIDGTGSISPEGDLAGEVRFMIDDVAAVAKIISLEEDPFLSGRFGVRLVLGGRLASVDALDIRGEVTTLDIGISGQRVSAERPIAFRLVNGKLEFDRAEIRSLESSFAVDGSVPLVGEDEIELTLRGKIDASVLQLVMPEARASGEVTVAIDVTGTIDKPRLRGTVEIQGGSLRVAQFPQGLDGVVATIDFNGRRIDIDSLTARSGGGTITAGGTLTLEGTALQTARMGVQGRGVSLRYYEGLTIESDFDLKLEGDAQTLFLQGDLDVSRALYAKNFDFASSLLNLLLERRELATEAVGEWQKKVVLRLDLKATDTLAVRNNVADVTGSADLQVTGPLSAPIILGRVTIDEGGKLRFQDVDYRVVQGTISFQNPFRNDPYLDITAEGRVAQSTRDQGVAQQYDLTVNLTGTLDRIQPTVTSDPPLGELTLLTLLAGDVAIDRARAQSGSVSTTGASLFLSTVGDKLGQKILPFADSVRFDPGLTGDSSSFSPTVMFEKRISNEIQVIVVYETASALNKEIVQWQISPEWVIQFTRDSEQATTYLVNALDVRFRRRYKGR